MASNFQNETVLDIQFWLVTGDCSSTACPTESKSYLWWLHLRNSEQAAGFYCFILFFSVL